MIALVPTRGQFHTSLRIRAAMIAITLTQLVTVPANAQTTCPEPSGSNTVENYCYDSLGRLTAQRRNDGAEASFDYDDADNRVSQVIDTRSNTVIFVTISGRPRAIVVPQR